MTRDDRKGLAALYWIFVSAVALFGVFGLVALFIDKDDHERLVNGSIAVVTAMLVVLATFARSPGTFLKRAATWVAAGMLVASALCLALAGKIVPEKDINRIFDLAASCDTNAFVKEFQRFDRLEVDINAHNGRGVSPLHIAAQKGCSGIVDFLLAHHVAPGLKDKDGTPPIKYALLAGHPETVESLLKAYTVVDLLTDDKVPPGKATENPSMDAMAALKGEIDSLKLLREHNRLCAEACRAQLDQEALAAALLGQQPAIIRYLLDNAASSLSAMGGDAYAGSLAVNLAKTGRLQTALAREVFERTLPFSADHYSAMAAFDRNVRGTEKK
jgi:hypothetical protein